MHILETMRHFFISSHGRSRNAALSNNLFEMKPFGLEIIPVRSNLLLILTNNTAILDSEYHGDYGILSNRDVVYYYTSDWMI